MAEAWPYYRSVIFVENFKIEKISPFACNRAWHRAIFLRSIFSRAICILYGSKRCKFFNFSSRFDSSRAFKVDSINETSTWCCISPIWTHFVLLFSTGEEGGLDGILLWYWKWKVNFLIMEKWVFHQNWFLKLYPKTDETMMKCYQLVQRLVMAFVGMGFCVLVSRYGAGKKSSNRPSVFRHVLLYLLRLLARTIFSKKSVEIKR